jgi:hypothetical protein
MVPDSLKCRLWSASGHGEVPGVAASVDAEAR